jgi:hypothetical protein
MNPLKTLILAESKRANISRYELALACGYQNATKGLRHIDNYIDSLIDSNDISAKLRVVLSIPLHHYALAVSNQRECIGATDRQLFKPCIQVVFSSEVKSPIFAAQFFLNIPLPPHINTLKFDDEMWHIFERYKANQLFRFADTKFVTKPENYEVFVNNLELADLNNEPYFYGIGLGYRYYKNYAECYTFNRRGELVSKTAQAMNKAALKVGGKDINTVLN